MVRATSWSFGHIGDAKASCHSLYDNLSSIQLAWNPVFHVRTKHIEVHYHFINKERVLAGDVDLTYVGTNEQVADIFTKALGIDKLQTTISSDDWSLGDGVELEGEC